MAELSIKDGAAANRIAARLPSIEELTEIVLDVEVRIKNDPTAARESIRKMLDDGRLVMEPKADGSYHAKGILLPLDLPPKSRKPRGGSGPSGASGVSHEVVGNDGCAGRI